MLEIGSICKNKLNGKLYTVLSSPVNGMLRYGLDYYLTRNKEYHKRIHHQFTDILELFDSKYQQYICDYLEEVSFSGV